MERRWYHIRSDFSAFQNEIRKFSTDFRGSGHDQYVSGIILYRFKY